MPEEKYKTLEIRKYLLGTLESDIEREEIEEKMFLDSEFFNEIQIQEEELIQEYADGDLEEYEREAFERNFLISDERREEVRFARALRKYVDQHKEGADEDEAANLPEAKISPGSDLKFWFKSFFHRPLTAFAAGAATIVFITLGGWYFYAHSSSAERDALIALNKAYRGSRPLESRISEFDYAPFKKERGAETSGNADTRERNLAERILLDEAAKNPSARNLHSLARLYLTRGDFDEAIQELEKAVALNALNPEILSDLGVAYLEKSKTLPAEQSNLDLREKALGSFKKALSLDPNFPAAQFNLAKCLEALNLPSQSREAWRNYLKLDADSPWAAEAKRRLQSLEQKEARDVSADELERNFLDVYRRTDAEAAFRLLSQNRELIKEKYLPQRLAMSLTDSGIEGEAEKLAALKFLGRLEKQQIDDSFAGDLAQYYANTGAGEKAPLLTKAQTSVRNGYRLCLQNDFTGALKEFETARELFLQAGNVFEANTICLHFIAYCFYNTDRRQEAQRLLQQVDTFCRQKKYRWFGLMNKAWLVSARESLGLNTSTDSSNEYEAALKEAENIGDSYMEQKFLLSLVSKSYLVRQEGKTLGYLQKLFEFSNRPHVSPRQKFRNFNRAIGILATSNLNSLAEQVSLESVSLAEPMTDPLFVIGSQINAGIVHTQAEDYENAQAWFLKAKQSADRLKEEAARKEQLAMIFLQLGHLERKRADYAAATRYYSESLSNQENAGTPLLLYETQKSNLLANQAAGNDSEVERHIPSTFELAEKYRSEILNEQERNSFFDNEQTVYDVAIEHEVRRGEIERAFNYAESSNSRSLLDWLRKGARISGEGQKIEIHFTETVKPLEASEIRQRMPSQVQLLQYTVLENKTLLWLVSREKFLVVPAAINSNQLVEKIENYLHLIQTSDAEKLAEARNIAQELYLLLIEPVLPHLDKKKEIGIIPNKVLFQMPFAALVAPDGNYFLQDFSFFYSPSANAFIFSTENAAAKAGAAKSEKILSVGNPSFDKLKWPDLARLPESNTEAEEAAANYLEAKLLLDENATKEAFLEAYKNFEVVHFAGHYLVDSDSPLHSKLIMAKTAENESAGVLTNAELMQVKLSRTKVVVLSACQTGVEKYYNGEGLTGLSRTFLSLGVPVVIASQWKVDSEASAELMKKFHYYRRQENYSSTNALRRAQLDMLAASNNNYTSPYFWAAFAAYGGYAEF